MGEARFDRKLTLGLYMVTRPDQPMHLLLSLSAVVIVYDVVVIVNQSSISHVCLHAHTL